jgi:ATP-dependent DNA helicase RecG
MATLDIETEQLEYKKSTAELKEATDSIAAMLNKHQSGVLYFGVKPNGDVVGQQVSEKTLREVSQTIRDRIEPRISPRIERVAIGGQTCVKVVFDGTDTPYSSSNVYFIRVADEDVKMTRCQLEEFCASATTGNTPGTSACLTRRRSMSMSLHSRAMSSGVGVPAVSASSMRVFAMP